MEEETLRLHFGTAATTIGTQWLALQQANGVTRKPHILAFEAKGRVQRQLRAIPKQQQNSSTWGGEMQVYDQSGTESMTGTGNDGLWDWARLTEQNLVEVDEFRPHMPLHNFYEGQAESNGGNVGKKTMEEAEDRVRTVLEACDQLRLVQTLVDMDSSWGGMAYEMLTYVTEECPSAVVMVVGNDWSYPMTSDDDEAVFRVNHIVRDRTKIEARKRVNVASSMALLSEVSNLLVPIAMSSISLPSSRFSYLRLDRSNCVEVSTVVATALELALSVHQGRSASQIVEGFQPNMKIAELSASFPHKSDPRTLLQYINDNSIHEVNRNSSEDPLENCSLLPVINQSSTEDHLCKTHYRRLHFRGAFSNFQSLRSAIDNSPLSVRDVALHWSDTCPLVLPQTFRLQMLQNSSVDAISQLSTGTRVGHYLSTLAQRVAKSEKRTMYEFTRAGMSPDALEELEAALAGMSDAYFAH